MENIICGESRGHLYIPFSLAYCLKQLRGPGSDLYLAFRVFLDVCNLVRMLSNLVHNQQINTLFLGNLMFINQCLVSG